jgi:hypothetical protein
LFSLNKNEPIKLKVKKTFIEIAKEKSAFTLSLAQWLKMHEMQKFEASLEKSGIHSLEDLYNKKDELIKVLSYIIK